MRRICMSALALSALSGSAYADSIQNIFSPYAPSQPTYAGQQQAPQAAPGQPMNVQPMNVYVPQRGLLSSGQAPAQASYAPPPPPAANGGGLFAALFGHGWGQPGYQPAAPDYQAQPQQGFAPSGQGDQANYQVDPKYDRQTVDYRTDEPAGTL